jgi:hypothetical protein
MLTVFAFHRRYLLRRSRREQRLGAAMDHTVSVSIGAVPVRTTAVSHNGINAFAS